jgi:hypothetical protein
MSSKMLTATILISLSACVGWAEKDMASWPVVYQSDFSSGNAEGWTFADPEAWKVASKGTRSFLSMFQDSNYKPPVRSPENIGWLTGLDVADFVLDATVRSTQKEYGHRDLCFLFNRVDETHYYYIHIATKADAHANSVFLVNGEPRVSIASERTDGTPWTEGWHHVRLVRRSNSGEILVYFDDMEKPIMRATDKTFTKGTVGFGSFDDTGDVAEIVIRGE